MDFPPLLLLMAEILHQLIGSLSHYLQGLIHPRWCRISAINSIMLVYWGVYTPQNHSQTDVLLKPAGGSKSLPCKNHMFKEKNR